MRPLRAIAALTAVLLPLRLLAVDSELREQDFPQLWPLKAKIEAAFNRNDPDGLLASLTDDFRGRMISAENVQGRDGFKAFLDKVKQRIGQDRGIRRYRIRLVPNKAAVGDDAAEASGTTEEEIETRDGHVYRFQTDWSARLRRQNGRWLLAAMDSRLSTRDLVSLSLQVVAQELRIPRLNLRAPKTQRPNFDGNWATMFKPAE